MVVEASHLEKPDEVDNILAAEDGQIQRAKGKDCRHNARQKCSHCLPLDPYDEDYLKEKDIKHMSFHSYVRKLTKGHGKGSQLKRPLENIRAEVNLNCDAHKPYPKGICTKCKPGIITLNRQRFRHVDNISFENQDLVNNFLDYWRKSGFQRVGYLIGRYQTFAEVPLGIKAAVAAIYEPPQKNSKESAGFLEDPHETSLNKLCSWLELKKVGWIFTDLWSADASKGSVHCIRHKDSYLISAEECITAGYLQSKHKNITEFCSDGHFGSKFVTVVASGDESENVNFHGYQVSNQCTALVEAQLLCPTNHPELAYIRDDPLHEQHYITDVEYTEKNEYGAEIRKDGRPLPVEFLLVDVPTGMPKDPEYTFHVDHHIKFSIENRSAINEHQNPDNLTTYCNAFSLNQFLEQATNFHFLLYLMTNPVVKFTDDEMIKLCNAVKSRDRGAAMDWAKKSENWQQLVTLCHVENIDSPPQASSNYRWACKHCTFENTEKRGDCSMCGLPAESA